MLPNCSVSVEFFYYSIPSKGSGSISHRNKFALVLQVSNNLSKRTAIFHCKIKRTYYTKVSLSRTAKLATSLNQLSTVIVVKRMSAFGTIRLGSILIQVLPMICTAVVLSTAL